MLGLQAGRDRCLRAQAGAQQRHQRRVDLRQLQRLARLPARGAAQQDAAGVFNAQPCTGVFVQVAHGRVHATTGQYAVAIRGTDWSFWLDWIEDFASLLPLMLAVRKTQAICRPFREVKGDADLSVPAAPVNAALTWLVRREAALARRVRMPFGSSLLMVGRKP